MIPPCYVISLKDNLGEQGEALKKAGLDPILFKGVNAKKGEHIQYKHKFHPFLGNFIPLAQQGASLAHRLLCEKLYKEGVEFALIMEDDAYLIEGVDLNYEIDKVLTEVPNDWEIIRLHCDSFCSNDNKIGRNASSAAYLINSRGLTTYTSLLIRKTVDVQQNRDMNTYKSRRNLFWTDETTSANRTDSSTYIFEYVLNYLFPIKTGEKTWNILINAVMFKIPYIDANVKGIDIISFIFVISGFIIFWYFNSK